MFLCIIEKLWIKRLLLIEYLEYKILQILEFLINNYRHRKLYGVNAIKNCRGAITISN